MHVCTFYFAVSDVLFLSKSCVVQASSLGRVPMTKPGW